MTTPCGSGVFAETAAVLKDSYFTEEDLSCDTDAVMQMFIDEKAAIFHGSPAHMQQCQAQMDAELVRLPYFSQTSNEGFIYMTPSLHIASDAGRRIDRGAERLFGEGI